MDAAAVVFIVGAIAIFGLAKLLGIGKPPVKSRKPVLVRPLEPTSTQTNHSETAPISEIIQTENRRSSTPGVDIVITDGVITETHTAPAISIPVTIATPSFSTPVAVGSISLQSSVIFERDEVFAQLNRDATQARSDGDMKLAVSLLQQAKLRQSDAYEDTRLALYLQHAGRYEEAMAEFDWLLSHVEAQVESTFGHTSSTERKYFIAYRRSQIHDKARLASQREKRQDLASLHAQLSHQYEREAKKFRTAADRAERKKLSRKQVLIDRS